MIIPKFNLYNAGWLDIVFDNRNKNYGAYELRSHYSDIMLKAISFTVFGVVASVLTISIATRKAAAPLTASEHKTEVNIQEILPPPPPVKPVKPVSPPAAATQSRMNTVVIPTRVTADPVTTDPPTLTEIAHSVIGTEAKKGDETGANIPVTTTGAGNGGDATESANNATDVLYKFADVSPEPNGGMAGWSKFLQSHIHYPDTEVQGRVILSFVVERDGSLTDIKIIRSVDSQLDAEALRVLKIAPKWKPGLQAGKPVRVQYTIPINFQLNN